MENGDVSLVISRSHDCSTTPIGNRKTSCWPSLTTSHALGRRQAPLCNGTTPANG